MKEYITLTVDGKSVKIEKGSTLLEAARKAGADIPTLCHDERVKPYGACGMCVVECKGSPKLMRSCAIEAADGMEIITESDRINRARRFSLEMLLSDHTGDCKAPCSLACPAGTDCQGYVGLIANGGNAQALSVIKGRIPLPASIGRVCPHPCEKKCRRGLVEEPISIAALKAYAADRDLESGNIFMPEVAESTGALVEKVPFKKNVPLREICTATHCTGCAAKCAINVFSNGNSITRCEPANGNIICAYGKFGLSKLANVGRLKVCKSGGESISLERAAEVISKKAACFSPAEIAVTVCENMTDNELEKAAELSQKLGCALVDMGNIDRDISADNCERFEKIFGTDFYIGANREKTVSLGAVDSDAIDFSKIKAVISFGGKTSEGNFDFAAVQSAKETGDVSLPFALSVECVGTIGEADISPALNPTYSNEEIIDAITTKIK